MRNLIFSHKSDIDGMGSVVFLELACENVDYELCETFNINSIFKEYYLEKKLYDYDKIYICDLCLDKDNLEIVKNDEELKNKILIFDHHESVEHFNVYDFANIIIKDDKGFCSGTSLFYNHLVSNNILKSNAALDRFCELIRRYDTWEWKNIYSDEEARDLSLVFESVGTEKFIKLMVDKLKNTEEFYFSEIEQGLIESRKLKMLEKVKFYVDNMVLRDVLGHKAAIMLISYEYRNEVAQYLIDNKYDVEFAILVAMDHNTISYRSVDPNMNVRIIAEQMGGKGHDNAAGSNISKEQRENILNILFN